ncbi:hypothetical protein K457DRAFT_519891 [Linnemannia elongata AG-77]|uniref:Transmembrane protein n=1 Tax=Linnemannia elongata AG-77 TaxID=1314771 RepID=A0A197JWH0_9FUNG|nr:hypothetical protein K457DRAFT_519891 [Linnemannia elongata AG-77]
MASTTLNIFAVFFISVLFQPFLFFSIANNKKVSSNNFIQLKFRAILSLCTQKKLTPIQTKKKGRFFLSCICTFSLLFLSPFRFCLFVLSIKNCASKSPTPCK